MPCRLHEGNGRHRIFVPPIGYLPTFRREGCSGDDVSLRRVTIADTGTGISKQDMTKLFEPFLPPSLPVKEQAWDFPYPSASFKTTVAGSGRRKSRLPLREPMTMTCPAGPEAHRGWRWSLMARSPSIAINRSCILTRISFDSYWAASITFSAYPTVSIALSIIFIFKIPPIIPPKQQLPSQILVPSARIFR